MQIRHGAGSCTVLLQQCSLYRLQRHTGCTQPQLQKEELAQAFPLHRRNPHDIMFSLLDNKALKVQCEGILIVNIELLTKSINRMCRNNSFKVITSMNCVAESHPSQELLCYRCKHQHSLGSSSSQSILLTACQLSYLANGS